MRLKRRACANRWRWRTGDWEIARRRRKTFANSPSTAGSPRSGQIRWWMLLRRGCVVACIAAPRPAFRKGGAILTRRSRCVQSGRRVQSGGPRQCRGWLPILASRFANLGRLTETHNATFAQSPRWTRSQCASPILAPRRAVLDRQGQDQPAIEHYTAASLLVIPLTCSAMAYLADAKMRVGLPGRGPPDCIQQALERTPRSARLQVSIALASGAGRCREARKVLEGALEAQPGNPEIINPWRELAICRRRPGATARGRSRWRRPSSRRQEIPTLGGRVCDGACRSGSLRSGRGAAKRSHHRRRAQRGRARIAVACSETWPSTSSTWPRDEGWPADDPLFQPRSPAARLAKNPYGAAEHFCALLLPTQLLRRDPKPEFAENQRFRVPPHAGSKGFLGAKMAPRTWPGSLPGEPKGR